MPNKRTAESQHGDSWSSNYCIWPTRNPDVEHLPSLRVQPIYTHIRFSLSVSPADLLPKIQGPISVPFSRDSVRTEALRGQSSR